MFFYVMQSLPRGSRVMSIFTKRALPAKMMLGEASSLFCHTSVWTMLKYISLQNLNKIYHGDYKSYEHFHLNRSISQNYA